MLKNLSDHKILPFTMSAMPVYLPHTTDSHTYMIRYFIQQLISKITQTLTCTYICNIKLLKMFNNQLYIHQTQDMFISSYIFTYYQIQPPHRQIHLHDQKHILAHTTYPHLCTTTSFNTIAHLTSPASIHISYQNSTAYCTQTMSFT